MKKFASYFLLIGITLLILSVKSFYAIQKPAQVFYMSALPGNIMAMTIPPFGILIEKQYESEGDGKGTILAHEKIHWLQYQEMGLWHFYFTYYSGLIKDGRLYNSLEEDARARSN